MRKILSVIWIRPWAKFKFSDHGQCQTVGEDIMKIEPMKVLSEAEIEKIHLHSLEILETIGIRVNLKKMRKLLADHGCRVDEGTKIVKFPPEVVEELVKKAPRNLLSVVPTLKPNSRWALNAGCGPAWVQPSGCWIRQR